MNSKEAKDFYPVWLALSPTDQEMSAQNDRAALSGEVQELTPHIPRAQPEGTRGTPHRKASRKRIA